MLLEILAIGIATIIVYFLIGTITATLLESKESTIVIVLWPVFVAVVLWVVVTEVPIRIIKWIKNLVR